jgi:hypothetical protein
VDSNRTQHPDDRTQCVRKRSASDTLPTDETSSVPDRTKPIRSRTNSGIRVWPPKPSPSSTPTIADFDLNSDSVKDDSFPNKQENIPDAIAIGDLCSKCQVKLIDPDGVGICPQCGVCRSLEENKDKVRTSTETLADIDLDESVPSIPFQIPPWVWVMLMGAVAIVLLSFVVNQYLPNPGKERTLWSIYQLVGGIVLLLVAQWWAIHETQSENERLGAWDLLVISGRVWNKAFRYMPWTRGPVYLGFWALVIMICAVTITGGLADWFPSKPTIGPK